MCRVDVFVFRLNLTPAWPLLGRERLCRYLNPAPGKVSERFRWRCGRPSVRSAGADTTAAPHGSPSSRCSHHRSSSVRAVVTRVSS